jgi:hypothetical protein
MKIIKVDYGSDTWHWNDGELTLVFHKLTLQDERNVIRALHHELNEAHHARALCGESCTNICDKLAPGWVTGKEYTNLPTPFNRYPQLKNRGICHILTFLIGRW